MFQYQGCKLYSLLILPGYLDYKHVHLHLIYFPTPPPHPFPPYYCSLLHVPPFRSKFLPIFLLDVQSKFPLNFHIKLKFPFKLPINVPLKLLIEAFVKLSIQCTDFRAVISTPIWEFDESSIHYCIFQLHTYISVFDINPNHPHS